MLVQLDNVVAHEAFREVRHTNQDEDGVHVWFEDVADGWAVSGCDAEGRIYMHRYRFVSQDAALKLAGRIVGAGYKIDATHWDMRVPYGSDAWLNDGMEVTLMDDEERRAKGM